MKPFSCELISSRNLFIATGLRTLITHLFMLILATEKDLKVIDGIPAASYWAMPKKYLPINLFDIHHSYETLP